MSDAAKGGKTADAKPRTIVRAATIADAPTIAEFNAQMAMETESLALDRAILNRGVRGVFDDPSRGRYFVAEVSGVVAGCLLITKEWSDWRNGDLWWIQSVYVHADHRRGGVFRAMYAHVREQAKSSGARAIRLYVERDNDRAKKTYASLGMHLTHYDIMQEDIVQAPRA